MIFMPHMNTSFQARKKTKAAPVPVRLKNAILRPQSLTDTSVLAPDP
jgi:hypothetical protein